MTLAACWELGRLPLALQAGDVHVWAVRLAPGDAELEVFQAWLSNDERGRAGRFQLDGKRQEYMVARACLRILAGHYQGCHPAELDFSYNAYGKPELLGGGLDFNLSHSGDLALMAFARGRAVGVDIERLDPGLDAGRLAESVFSTREYREFSAVPADQMVHAFYNGWTRKEACIKAFGQGLSFPLSAFDVTLEPGRPARLLRVAGSEDEAQQWTLHDLAPFPGSLGAVVARGRDWRLSCFAFPDSETARLQCFPSQR